MGVLLMVLIMIVCVLLTLVILVQNSKGGGLAAGFSSANQIGGVRRTTDFLEKSTWTLVIALLFLSIVSSSVLSSSQGGEAQTDGLEEKVQQEVTPAAPAGQQLPALEEQQPQEAE